MPNNLYIICGKSGAGKDSISDEICKRYGLKKILSNTTRPKRENERNTHTFVTIDEFNQIRKDLVAYTLFNGYEYGATNKQVNENDIYILDRKGIQYFKKNYKGDKRFKVIYINVPEDECKQRMLNRGESIDVVEKRVTNDNIEFEGIQHLVDASIKNDDLNICIRNVWDYICECEKGKPCRKPKCDSNCFNCKYGFDDDEGIYCSKELK